jgi:hypothetical protein
MCSESVITHRQESERPEPIEVNAMARIVLSSFTEVFEELGPKWTEFSEISPTHRLN